ncbi:hypothetical protein IFM89_007650 [Coptis chinensis]|uniref:Uncharacterized protein n=1 Tax=Coptis chinensis TaxID=261450 RepID=A0A835HSE0_9MAGN|nr:hypothetical protein IFM89_007650 [Coptis chinensis]
MEQEIKAEFENSGFTLDQEEDILKKCLTFCINYKLSASDLVSSWEVYCLNRQLNGSVVQNGHMDGFLLRLQNEQKESLIKEEAHPHIYSSNDVDMILSEEHEENKEGTIGTPVDRKERLYTETIDSTPGTNVIVPSSGKSSRLSTSHVTPFGQRINKFVVQFTLNEFAKKENDSREQEIVGHEDDIIRRVQPSERCSLEVQRPWPESGCRFMYDRIEDKFNSLENRIRRLTTAFVASGLYEESVDPTMASQFVKSAANPCLCFFFAMGDPALQTAVKSPLYYVNDDLGKPITNTRLNGHNYLSWSYVVEHFIRAKKKSKILTGDPPDSTDPTYENLMASNSMVLTWLWNSMEPKPFTNDLEKQKQQREQLQVALLLHGLNSEYSVYKDQILASETVPSAAQAFFAFLKRPGSMVSLFPLLRSHQPYFLFLAIVVDMVIILVVVVPMVVEVVVTRVMVEVIVVMVVVVATGMTVLMKGSVLTVVRMGILSLFAGTNYG